MSIHTPSTREDLARLLAPMRLAVDVFEHAVALGAAESRTFSSAAPKSAANSVRWFRTVEAMHEELMLLQLGWKRSDPENLPYFSQSDVRIGLITSSGDASTGVPWGRSPSTKNPKGAAFARRVDENGQGSLFGPLTGDGEQVEVKDLWILLYNERDGAVYMELSRPKSMSGAKIDTWLDRIVFPPFDIALGALSFDEGEGPDETFSFKIARR